LSDQGGPAWPTVRLAANVLRILVMICFISTLVPLFAQDDLRPPTRLAGSYE